MTTTSTRTSGVGIGTVLLVVFLTLKLAGLITWSWWWVLAPLWAPIALLGVAVLLAAWARP